jgi:predicted DNA-binding transcriptional regulator AlpA
MQEILTKNELMLLLLRLSEASFFRLEKKGKLPPVIRLCGQRRYVRAAVELWMTEQQNPQAA